MSQLMEYDWPGNVRELENAIEHAFVKTRTSTLMPQNLPREIAPDPQHSVPAGRKHTAGIDRHILIAALEQTGWNQARTARKLGINRTTVWRKMRAFNIVPPPE